MVKKHVLVIVDAFTKHVKLYAIKSTMTREIGCLKDYFRIYSQRFSFLIEVQVSLRRNLKILQQK